MTTTHKMVLVSIASLLAGGVIMAALMLNAFGIIVALIAGVSAYYWGMRRFKVYQATMPEDFDSLPTAEYDDAAAQRQEEITVDAISRA